MFTYPNQRSPRDTVGGGNNRQNVIQHLRTATPNYAPPNNFLLDGELAIEQADPMKIWVGCTPMMDSSGRKLLFDASMLNGGIAFVIHDASLTGDGTMTNPLSVDVVDGGTF